MLDWSVKVLAMAVAFAIGSMFARMTDRLKTQEVYQFPPGKTLRCELVDKI